MHSIEDLIATAPPRENRTNSGAWIAFVRRYMDARPSTTDPQYPVWAKFYCDELLKEAQTQPTERSDEHFFRFKVNWEIRKFCGKFPTITRPVREDLRQGLFVYLLDAGIDFERSRGEVSKYIATLASRYLAREIQNHMGPVKNALAIPLSDELTKPGVGPEGAAILRQEVERMDEGALAATMKRQKI